jgi:HAE1 family hydrophobic/amphiphilic exporter-1
MLGFIILIGIVVNNAILIVHQSLNNIKYSAMPYKEAIIEATRSRLRPIFMSSLTSVFGMLPLVLVPGPGSEFYRGLGSVITGGLALSMLFTILVTPALLYLFLSFKKDENAKEIS